MKAGPIFVLLAWHRHEPVGGKTVAQRQVGGAKGRKFSFVPKDSSVPPDHDGFRIPRSDCTNPLGGGCSLFEVVG